MIYLASPYTAPRGLHKIPTEKQRGLDAAKACAVLWQKLGKPVYSPIAHGTAIEGFLYPQNAIDHDFWMKHCLDMLSRCDELYVLKLDGWDKSKGVEMELKLAEKEAMPVTFIHPVEAGL